MTSGLIEDNKAISGGGVWVSNWAQFNMNAPANNDPAGIITGNTAIGMGANDGGGLHVNHSHLDRIRIDESFIFTNNAARNGLRIDTPLAVAQQSRIRPGTVTITGWSIITQTPVGTGDFGFLSPVHAFTNYDINCMGPYFWRVAYIVGRGQGELGAEVGQNNFPVPNNSFVSDGATLTFDASPGECFEDWEIRTRPREIDSDGESVEFDFRGYGTD